MTGQARRQVGLPLRVALPAAGPSSGRKRPSSIGENGHVHHARSLDTPHGAGTRHD
ncbi:hypothetical protein [Bombella mellum]|uniref:hypothetical protein n=1 Tax=Bombella mellum TaxID=2039288 RepID=UPI0015F64DD4|nr:hypothetical protein [Bombella mellum]